MHRLFHAMLATVFVMSFGALNAHAHSNTVVVPLLGDSGPQEVTIQITASDFTESGNNIDTILQFGDHVVVSHEDTFLGNLETSFFVPEGATIKSWACYVFDDDSSIQAFMLSTINLKKREVLSTSATTIATIFQQTAGADSRMRLLTSGVAQHSPATKSSVFSISARLQTGLVSFDLRFYGCSVTMKL